MTTYTKTQLMNIRDNISLYIYELNRSLPKTNVIFGDHVTNRHIDKTNRICNSFYVQTLNSDTLAIAKNVKTKARSNMKTYSEFNWYSLRLHLINEKIHNFV